ncbi:hypothetical protein K439DRAFT_1544909 [Ramaria rubella]|nr:hypothetical protein K439DRAFT_1544909 [Ramaria rubella]
MSHEVRFLLLGCRAPITVRTRPCLMEMKAVGTYMAAASIDHNKILYAKVTKRSRVPCLIRGLSASPTLVHCTKVEGFLPPCALQEVLEREASHQQGLLVPKATPRVAFDHRPLWCPAGLRLKITITARKLVIAPGQVVFVDIKSPDPCVCFSGHHGYAQKPEVRLHWTKNLVLTLLNIYTSSVKQ